MSCSVLLVNAFFLPYENKFGRTLRILLAKIRGNEEKVTHQGDN